MPMNLFFCAVNILFLLPQMESERKKRKYSTSSNDSDTTDSKLDREPDSVFVYVNVCGAMRTFHFVTAQKESRGKPTIRSL